MLVEALTPNLELGPGEQSLCRARVTNNGSAPARYAVRLHGLGPVGPYIRLGDDYVAPQTSIEFDLPVVVPEGFSTGDHDAAIEVRSDQRQEAPVIANFAVAVGTTDHIAAQIIPSVIRSHRRAKFNVEIANKRTVPTQVDLIGSAPTMVVTLAEQSVVLQPGQTRRIKGRAVGPRHISGEPLMHSVMIETTANSMPSYSTAAVRQKAIVPWRLRAGVVGLAVLVVWALIAIGGAVWLANRGNNATAPSPTTALGSTASGASSPGSAPASGAGSGTATANGSATNGTAAGANSGAGGAGGATGAGTGSAGGAGGGAANTPAVPTQSVVKGTVKAGSSGADSDVHITLTPTTPDPLTPPPGGTTATAATTAGTVTAMLTGVGSMFASVLGGPSQRADGSSDIVKRWPARYGTYDGGAVSSFRTFSVPSVTTGADGTYQFPPVPLHRSYELSFAKDGYTTRSVIVTPTDDGKPVQVDMQLLPGDGAIDGKVTSSGVGLGGVHVSATDGTVVLQTTTSTDPKLLGQWSLTGLSTPATYTVTFTLDGYGTQVAQVILEAGKSSHNLPIVMTSGVGSIRGTVFNHGVPLGGITITASAGDKSLTTTSVTDGAVGTYDFPQLTLGASYIITASADGYITQSRGTTVNGNETGVDFNLVSTTGSIVGLVLVKQATGTADPVPLPLAGVSVSANGLQVNKQTAASGDIGSFLVTELPPGSYVVTVSRYDTTVFSQLVTLLAGDQLDLGHIVVTHQDPPAIPATGSLIVRSISLLTTPINGATVQLADVGNRRPALTLTMGPNENSVQFNNLAIGTYSITVTKNNYRPNTVAPFSIGLTPLDKTITLLQYGTARGTVIDRLGGTHPIPLKDDRGNPVFQNKAGVFVYFDPTKPIVPIPASAGAGAAFAYFDTTGMLVVLYTNGTYLRSVAVGAPPTEELTAVTEPVGNIQLDDYELLLYRTSGATFACVAEIPVAAKAPRDQDGRVEWQIDPTLQLLSGTYALRFAPAPGDNGSGCASHGRVPAGFASVPVDAAGDAATFEIAANSDEKIVVPPIGVAPFPTVSGTVVVPYKNNGVLSFTNFDSASAGTVNVSLKCGAAVANATGTAAGPKVTFNFDRVTVAGLFTGVAAAADGTLPACTISGSTTSPGFLPNTTPLTLREGYVAPYPDQVLSLALVQDPGIVSGSVFWIDLGRGGAQVPVTGFAIAAAGTTGFDTGKTTDPDGPGPNTTVVPPNPAPTAGAFKPTITGQVFAFDAVGQRQVIDTTDYVFTQPDFDPTTMTVTANKDSADVAWKLTPTALVSQTGSNATVLLTPKPGTITGTLTDNPPFGYGPGFSEVTVSAVAPGATTTTPVTVVGSGYSVKPAAAGTWAFNYSVSPSSQLEPYHVTQPLSVTVPPNGLATVPPVPFVVLSHLTINIKDTSNNPVTDQAVTVTISKGDTTAEYPAGFAPITKAPAITPVAGSGVVDFARLPIADAPANQHQLPYLLTVTAPGYESNAVSFVLFDQNRGQINSTTSLANVATVAFEGSNVVGTLVLKKFGSLTGTVTGHLADWATPPTEILVPGPGVPGTSTGGLVVTATSVADPTKQFTGVASGTTYVISAPAGAYTVHFQHPDYDIPADVAVTLTPGQSTPLDANLFLSKGTLVLSTISSNKPITYVAETVGLWASNVADAALVPGTVKYPFTSLATGPTTFDGVYPGTYTMMITQAGYFPIIATITIPRGRDAGTRTLTVTALTTLIDGEISGTVTAHNTRGEAVVLPVNATINRTFDGIVPDPTGTVVSPVSNRATESNLPLVPALSLPLVETVAGSGAAYDFTGLPRGVHHLSVSTDPAYDAPNLTPALTGGTLVTGKVTGPAIDYTAHDVTVNVSVDGPAGTPVTDATVTMTPTTGTGLAIPVTNSPSGVYALLVPPSLIPYTLTVAAPLHSPSAPQSITVNPSATALPEAVTLAQTATIAGTVYEQTSSATPGTATGGIHVVLTGPAGTTPQGYDSDASTGNFTFTVTVAGTYHVDVSPPIAGFGPGGTGDIVVALGTAYTNKVISIPQLPTAGITLAGLPATTTDASVSVTPSTGVTKSQTVNLVNFTGLTPGTAYTFTTTGTGIAVQSFTVTPIAGQAVTHTFTWSELVGVLNITSASAPGVAVNVTLTGPNGYNKTLPFTGAAATNDYSFTGLELGRYTVSATRAWDNAAATVAFDLGAGGATSNASPPSISPISLTLPAVPAQTISGTITDSITTNAIAASVTLTNSAATVVGGPTVIGADGRYSFGGITIAGTYTVTASLATYVTKSLAVVVTGPTPAKSGQNIALDPVNATAAITLVNAPAGTTVSVSPSAGVSGPTGTSPNFSFSGLLPGTLYTFTSGGMSFQVAPANAQAITHTFTWTNVAGTVLGLSAAGRATVTILNGATTVDTRNVTDVAPAFSFPSLPSLPTGSYTLHVVDTSATPKVANLTFDVLPGGGTSPPQGDPAWSLSLV